MVACGVWAGQIYILGIKDRRTGKPQTLILDEKDIPLLKGKRAALIDDVISTGSTLDGMRAIIKKAGGQVSVEAAIFTEGDPSDWKDVIALGHLPVFVD